MALNLRSDCLWSQAGAYAIWKKIKEADGAVTRSNTNYCGAKFQVIENVFFWAATTTEWENLCEDDDIMTNIARANIEEMKGRQVVHLLTLLPRIKSQ